MPAATPKGYPYPLGGDPVAQGDDAIKALAERIDARLPMATAAARANIADVPANGTKAVVVALPAGRFTAVPAVQAVVYGSNVCWAVVGTVTATSASVTVRSISSAPANCTVAVQAVQMTATSGDG